MAGIYLSKCEADASRRDFHLGDKPLEEVARQFGVRPQDRQPEMPGLDPLDAKRPLFVVVSVPQEEAQGTAFEAGYYRAIISPHHALRRCGVGLSDILGKAQEAAEG